MCWKAEYLVLIWISTLIDYFCAIRMSNRVSKKDRLPYLIVSLISNLGILFAFKYFVFFNSSLKIILENFNILYQIPEFKLLLPVGISFYTFQALSYSIDVYQAKIKAERHLGYFALYIAYFPQLVAGPIERCKQLLPQLKTHHKFNYLNLRDGLVMILWGLFRKIVIADSLAIYVDEIFANHTSYNGFSILLAAYLFAFQVYLDFAAYSDIALGAARVMGVKLMTNFRHPFLSTSLSELWKRWHISLMTWFRDYIFLPLSHKQDSILKRSMVVLLIFLISGLWHGANWTFVTWGLLNGVFLILENHTTLLRKSIYERLFDGHTVIKNMIKILITFNIFALFTVFFRSPTVNQAQNMLARIFDFSSYTLDFNPGQQNLLIFSVIILSILMYLETLEEKSSFIEILSNLHICLRWLVYCILITACVAFVPYNSEQFIYFQF